MECFEESINERDANKKHTHKKTYLFAAVITNEAKRTKITQSVLYSALM